MAVDMMAETGPKRMNNYGNETDAILTTLNSMGGLEGPRKEKIEAAKTLLGVFRQKTEVSEGEVRAINNVLSEAGIEQSLT